MRLCELAAGDFFNNLKDLSQKSSTTLLRELPRDLDASAKGVLLRCFERGRAFLAFQFSLKLCSYAEPPCLLFACAHHDIVVQRRASRQCLTSSCTHPRTLELKTEPLRSEADQFIAGADLTQLMKLPLCFASLKFGHCSERKIEGGHAQINIKTAGKRYRTEAFDSLALRWNKYEAMLNNSDGDAVLKDMSLYPQKGSNPKMMLGALGLRLHTGTRVAKQNWDPIYRKILYRSDPWSKYRQCVSVQTQHDGPDDPGELPRALEGGSGERGPGDDLPAAGGGGGAAEGGDAHGHPGPSGGGDGDDGGRTRPDTHQR
eukprot:3379876-Pyramimonas_sp.AAC.1